MKKVLVVCHDNLMYGASKSLLDWVGTVDKDTSVYDFLFVVPATGGPLKAELEKLNRKVIQIRYYQPIKKFNKNSLSIKLKNIARQMLCRFFNPIAISKISEICREEGIDLIHSNSFVISKGAEAAIRNNLPHVWHIREFMEEDHMMSYIYSDSYIKNLTQYSYPIYISRSIEKKYESYFPIAAGHIIYNTISYDASYKKTRKFVEDGICNLIIAGKITKNKGQMEAVKAVEAIVNKGYKAKLYICGEGPDEPLIREYIGNHFLQKSVELLGFRKDVTEIRKNMDIALMCSNNEAFGRVTVEGLYYENLVIGKKSAGTEEIITSGVNGLLYDTDDSEALVNLIIDMIDNKYKAESMIIVAKKEAISNFSKTIFPLVENVYVSAIGDK